MSFATVDPGKAVWEYGALVTALDAEIRTLGQLYRDRGDCENNFDEAKNQWGWAGFTPQDLKRCGLMARCVALVFDWWNLFVRPRLRKGRSGRSGASPPMRPALTASRPPQ